MIRNFEDFCRGLNNCGFSMGGEASREIAAKIPGAELLMYEQWGHGLYEEAKEFNQVVRNFLRKNP